MYSSSILPLAVIFSMARAHGVILAAQGDDGSPPSVGFKVNDAIARNCTTISPCQLDSTIIRDAEIEANIVNKCGRTQLAGNIDVAEETEKALQEGAVTQVQAGSDVTVTIHQVNVDGAGPYVCDLDMTSNSGQITHNLTVTNNIPGSNGISDAKTQDFNITVTMPDDLNCVGASTGDICTVRCRNNAQAGPFGGCFAVQQTDTTPQVNTPANIATELELDAQLAQLATNQADLPKAIQANQNAGSAEAEQNALAVSALLGLTDVAPTFPTETPDAALGNGPPASSAATQTEGGSGQAEPTGATTGDANGGAVENSEDGADEDADAGDGNGNGGGSGKGKGKGKGRNNNNNKRL